MPDILCERPLPCDRHSQKQRIEPSVIETLADVSSGGDQHALVGRRNIAEPFHCAFSRLHAHPPVKTMTLRAKRDSLSAKHNAWSLRSVKMTGERLCSSACKTSSKIMALRASSATSA
ncbi:MULTISPECIES: hypothetical protein [unclassified Bradyrhizobium]|uniref:hypothetical protein n=1 Tax=unclassified Bradyrhizobium TaxID=2631580 RepID=UPI0024E058DD|nr:MULTISPECIES: hypothetical protein [unclassified Bradyrhizobium]